MTCSRLSLGALVLTLAISLAGLALASGALASAFQRASSARQALSSTVSAGLAPQHRPVMEQDQSS